MAAKKENLLLFFDRPTEPVFMAKGDRNAVFEVPNNFLVSFREFPSNL